MPVITINGVIGSGTLEIGHLVAQNMGLNYVDRYIFSEAARLVGSPVSRLIEKEQRVIPFREKVARFMQTVLERSAVAGAGAEPYFGRGLHGAGFGRCLIVQCPRPSVHRSHHLGYQGTGRRWRRGNHRARQQHDPR